MDVTLTADTPGRLDVFVHAAIEGASRRLVHRLLAEGAVRVNGRAARKGTLLRPGDRVTIPALPARLAPEPALALPVVHEDAHLAVVEKPGGMPSHALDPRQCGTAAAFIVARYPETATIGDRFAPGLVHRLDTGTSGLLLAARTAEVHATLRRALRGRQVEKRYLAVVAGDARDIDGVRVDVALAHDPRDRRRMRPAAPGLRAWPAETLIELRARAGDRSLLEATIRTGVTHQVRAHLAHLGHPVAGDVLYGGAPVDLPAGRHALHATHLRFAHPADGRLLTLVSELPGDLRALLA